VIADFKYLKEQYKIDSIIINDSNFFTNENGLLKYVKV